MNEQSGRERDNGRLWGIDAFVVLFAAGVLTAVILIVLIKMGGI